METPFHPDAVSTEWLTDVLRASGTLTHARVTSLRTQLLGSEKGMTGQLARLCLGYDTDEIRQIGAWLGRHLGQLSTYLYQELPCTLIHNDYQADNLFFLGSGNAHSFAVIDWQLTIPGRGAYDAAYFLGGNLDTQDRRNHELRLLRAYHTLLLEHGVRDYPFDRCLDDYRLAMLQTLSRLIAVIGAGVVPPEQERGFCDVLVPRYCRAVHDLKVGEVVNAAFSHGSK